MTEVEAAKQIYIRQREQFQHLEYNYVDFAEMLPEATRNTVDMHYLDVLTTVANSSSPRWEHAFIQRYDFLLKQLQNDTDRDVYYAYWVGRDLLTRGLSRYHAAMDIEDSIHRFIILQVTARLLNPDTPQPTEGIPEYLKVVIDDLEDAVFERIQAFYDDFFTRM